MSITKLFCQIAALPALILCVCAMTARCQIARYTVSGEKVLKNDSEFVMHGININGPGFPNRHKITDDVALIVDTWKFNTIRVACKVLPAKEDPRTSCRLDDIVDAFTARGILVIISPRDHVGSFYEDPPKPDKSASLSDLVAWYKDIARRFSKNPSVWFEVQAGPGNRDERQISEQYLFTHETIIQTIRKEVQAPNVIVCSGYGMGQDDANWGSLFTPENSSAILSIGPDLISKWSNLVFAFNAWEGWNAGGVAKLTDFVDRVRAKHMPVFVSEYGLHSWADASYAAEAVLAVSKSRRLGHCAWQWNPNDRSCLCATDDHPGGWDIDRKDGSRPSNLTFLGDRVWTDNHSEPFHGPALDSREWTARSFTGDAPKNNRLNRPEAIFADYVLQDETWSSEVAQAPGQWFEVDMQKPQTFTRIQIDARSFSGDYPRGYSVYTSMDGKSWGAPIASGKNSQAVLRVSFPTRTARFIRVELTEKTWHWWHISSFTVYAPFGAAVAEQPRLPVREELLDMHGWLATAGPSQWYDAQMALRQRQNDWERATSSRHSEPGDFYQVDMQEPRKFHKIVINAGRFSNEFLRGYEVYTSLNALDWGKPVATGRGAPITTITFPTVNARYIRIVQTRKSVNDWVITEFRVFGAAKEAR